VILYLAVFSFRITPHTGSLGISFPSLYQIRDALDKLFACFRQFWAVFISEKAVLGLNVCAGNV
jgi:hypothetical protein